MNYCWCRRVSRKHGLILLSQVNSILCPPPVFRAALLYRHGAVVGHCGTGHNFRSKTGFLGAASQCSEKCIAVFILNHRAPKQAPAQRSSSLKGTSSRQFHKVSLFQKKELKRFRFPILYITKFQPDQTEPPGVTQYYRSPRDTCVQFSQINLPATSIPYLTSIRTSDRVVGMIPALHTCKPDTIGAIRS